MEVIAVGIIIHFVKSLKVWDIPGFTIVGGPKGHWITLLLDAGSSKDYTKDAGINITCSVAGEIGFKNAA